MGGFQQTKDVARFFAERFKAPGEAELLFMLAGADLVEGVFALEPGPKVPKPWTPDSVGGLLAQLDGIIIVGRRDCTSWSRESVHACLREKLKGTEHAARVGGLHVIAAENTQVGDISSTEVRELVDGGRDSEEAQERLKELVGGAVQRQLLYRTCGENPDRKRR